MTTQETINFNYSPEDVKLFKNNQEVNWRAIENSYIQIRLRCMGEIIMPSTASHKVWIEARVNRLLVTSIMRLLYLGESFQDTSLKFNAPSTAVHVKAMVEPVLHVANLVWILRHKDNFDEIRAELARMAYCNRATNELTTSAKISQKELYTRADELIHLYTEGVEKEYPNLFQILYQDSNATGHHNFEGRDMLIGLPDKQNVWRPKDRKEWFIFLSSNIFPFFMYTRMIFSMTSIFIGEIDYHLENMPDTLPRTKKS